MRIAFALLALAASTTTGCYRYVTRMPGVVDLRTDGSEAQRVIGVKPAADQHREGVLAIAVGHGAHAEAGRVDVEDRHFWILGAIPIANTSARDEVDAAVKTTGALRGVAFGEQIGPIDALFFLAGRMLPLVPYVTPSYTFHMTGEAIEAPLSVVQAPAPPVAAPAPEPLDVPPPPGIDEPPPLLDPAAQGEVAP